MNDLVAFPQIRRPKSNLLTFRRSSNFFFRSPRLFRLGRTKKNVLHPSKFKSNFAPEKLEAGSSSNQGLVELWMFERCYPVDVRNRNLQGLLWRFALFFRIKLIVVMNFQSICLVNSYYGSTTPFIVWIYPPDLGFNRQHQDDMKQSLSTIASWVDGKSKVFVWIYPPPTHPAVANEGLGWDYS